MITTHSFVSNTFNTLKLGEQVTGGSIKVDIKYGIFSITLIDKTLDLCDTVKSAGVTCPLAAGDQNLAISESIPSVAPSVCIHIILMFKIIYVCRENIRAMLW